MRTRFLITAALVIVGVAPSLLSQYQEPERLPFREGGTTPTAPAAIAAGPVPRLHDGKPDLSGPWLGGGSNQDIERDGGLKPGELDSLMLPWAKKLRDSRHEKDEPFVACLPMGVPRTTVYPFRIVQSYTQKGMTHIFILHETGGGGTFRQIFMDGRKHPDDLLPRWFGHSIGWWEGDTLVIDTVGYNDLFWFDARGTPHTEQLHTIERWTRINYGTLVNDFTLDDPGTFSKPIHLRFTAKALRPGDDLMEFVCLEDNQYGVAGGAAIPTVPR